MAAGLKISQTKMLSYWIAVLHGPGVLGEHCVLENLAGTVTLIPKEGALCSVNGSLVTGPSQLTQGENFNAYPHAQGGDGHLKLLVCLDCELGAVTRSRVVMRPLHIFLSMSPHSNTLQA